MITLTTAAWITLALITIISILMMKATIPLIGGKGSDNGWDNAVAYTLGSGLIAFILGWFGLKSWMFAMVAPMLAWTLQTLLLKHVYELRTARAWLVGMVHATFTSAVTTALGLTVAFVVAYILYGKIISDPMFLIRLLLKLIGIELPFHFEN